MDELLGEFVAETLETLDTLSGEVVAWEADPTDRSRLDAFFRFFHTVKGSCGFLNLPRFERLSHGAEDVLAAFRRGERTPDPATISAVLAVMDRIGSLARAISDASDPVPESEDDALLDALSVDSGVAEVPVLAPDLPAPTTAECESSAAARRAPRERAPRTIRLPLALIDQLMSGISDMVLARNDLARKMREQCVDPELESSFERLSANVADLRDMISKTRMQRVDRLYAAVPRLVRDLTRELGKKVVLELDGGDVEMDREMIEMVADPLTHIVRNALDHGVETPAERVQAGKPEAGTLRIVARQSGNQIVVEISDDGGGVNRNALVDKAIAAGLLSAGEAAALNEAEKLNLIFHPGLSTADQVTAISGRGVGMDVVRANIEQIGGVISVTSKLGTGTTITMRVPLTLTIIPGLIVRCGETFFAMPRGNVVELLHQNSSMVSIEEIGGACIATIRGERLAMIELEDVLRRRRASDEAGQRTLMVIRSSVGQPYVLGVEAVESNEELVIRPASPVIAAAGIFAGMTLPDNGQPMLLLDAAGIAQRARLPQREADARPAASLAQSQPEAKAPTIQALHFREHDGRERLLPLAIVDRVEDIEASQVTICDGKAFVRIEDRLLPALNPACVTDGIAKSLRLHDGEDQLCYLIADVIDILEAPARLDARIASGRIAGLVLVDDARYEMLDPFALFAEAAHSRLPSAQRASGPVHCLIADEDDAWMRNILASLLIQAGHNVSFGTLSGNRPDVVLCSEDRIVCPVDNVPVVALREGREPSASGQSSIYRYDRDQIMAAIASAARSVA